MLWIFHVIKKNIKLFNINVKTKIILKATNVRPNLWPEKSSLVVIKLKFF